jgi:hypothetical protein
LIGRESGKLTQPCDINNIIYPFLNNRPKVRPNPLNTIDITKNNRYTKENDNSLYTLIGSKKSKNFQSLEELNIILPRNSSQVLLK